MNQLHPYCREKIFNGLHSHADTCSNFILKGRHLFSYVIQLIWVLNILIAQKPSQLLKATVFISEA